MIPKVIHYCWFGRGQKNELIQRCIASWRKYLPDYKIVEWNEDTFDIASTLWTKQAYEAKKWAFVSDYVRLYALYTQGGLYFDTDVEVLKPFDRFLDNELLLGFESNDMPTTAVIGSQAGNHLIHDLIGSYSNKPFIRPDGDYEALPNPYIMMPYLKKMGICFNGKEQLGTEYHIYPAIVFSPNNLTRIWNHPSPKSYTIHHFDQSWTSSKKKVGSLWGRTRRWLLGVMRNTLGTERTYNLKERFTGLVKSKS